MKKIITIILIFISFNSQAQDGRVLTLLQKDSWKVDFSEQDKQKHIAFWYFEGIVVTSVTYGILKDTKLKPFWAKFWSTAIGIAGGVVIGDFVENYQRRQGGFYNPKDLVADIYGSIGGSFTISLALWNSVPLSKVPEGAIIYDSRFSLPEVWDKRRIRFNKRSERKGKRNQRKIKRN